MVFSVGCFNIIKNLNSGYFITRKGLKSGVKKNSTFTVRNVVAARLCVHRGGGCVADTSLRQTPPGRHPQADTPWADTPCQVHAGIHTPPAQCMLGYTASWPNACWDTHPPSCPVHAGIYAPTPNLDGYCSGRYASYWNAFLSY